MQMSTDGLISWDVPAVGLDDKVSVSVLISNERNQIRDTFSLRKLADRVGIGIERHELWTIRAMVAAK